MQAQEEANNRIRAILTDLEDVRESLLVLSDDIWLSIEHNNPEALDQGYQFKKEYNNKVVDFNRLATELSSLIEQFTHVEVETPISSSDVPEVPVAQLTPEQQEQQRIIRQLDRQIAHSLDEEFTYTKPYGFMLGDYAVANVGTWRRLYRLFWDHVSNTNGARVAELAAKYRLGVVVATERAYCREPVAIAGGYYVDGWLSAKAMTACLRNALYSLDINPDEMKIYLREYRNALVSDEG